MKTLHISISSNTSLIDEIENSNLNKTKATKKGRKISWGLNESSAGAESKCKKLFGKPSKVIKGTEWVWKLPDGRVSLSIEGSSDSFRLYLDLT